MKKTIFLLLHLFVANILFAQTQFWSDAFESTAPSSGTRTASIDFTCGTPTATAYFTRTTLASLNLQNGSYSVFEGSYIWAGEDIDMGTTCTNVSVSPNQQVTWTGINISGKSGLSFKGLFAANGSLSGNWEGTNFAPNQDFLAVEYRIDGGAWTKILAFYATGITNTQTLALDTDGDLIGDGTSLGYAFAEFSANIAGTGTTLDLRFNCSANGSAAEELAVDNFRLYSTPALSATQSQVNLTCNNICNGSATVVASGGTSPYTYSWSPSGGSGATASSLCATNYTCTITDASSASITKTFNITQPATITVTLSSQTNISCNGGSNGAATINTPTGGAGGFTYNWTPGNPTGDGTVSVTGLISGTWTCTVTDANACTATKTFNITQPTAISVTPASQTNISCFGGSNGAASVSTTGGAGAYTYNWTPGNPTGDGTASVTGLTSGTWTCTVTDANSCTATQAFNITQPATISVTPASQTNISCFGGSNGAASINTPTGGAGGFTYNWTPGNPTGDGTVSVTGLTAGAWTCTVTDANSCTATQTFNVTQPTALNGSTVVTNVACNGGTNGAINLTPSGGTPGYTFSWASGPTTEDRIGLAAGSYSVTITDANSCTKTVSGITVTQPTAISGSTVVTNVACNGGTNGAINLTPSGGAGAYTFSWASGPTTEDRTGLAAGSYSVTITDANSCTKVVSGITVTQPSAISGSTVVTNVACNGGTNGAINLTPSGGTPGYTFSWASGPTTEDRTGLAAGSYSVTITDANSCTKVVSGITVTQPTAITASTSQNNITCNGGNNGSATVTVSGGAGSYTYSWSPSGGTAATATGLAAGSYTCTIEDANTCQTTKFFTLTQPIGSSWTGAFDTDWNNTTNWCGSIPTGTTDVTFNSGAPNYPVISGTVSLKNLTVNSLTSLSITGTLQVAGSIANSGTITATSGTIELNGTTSQTIPVNTFSSNTIKNLIINNTAGVTVGGPLNITGTLTPTAGVLTTGGFITLKSSATGTGRIGTGLGSGGYISGIINSEKYIVGGGFASAIPSRRGYRFLSHPFTTAIPLTQLNGEIDITGTGGATNGFDPTLTNNPSAFYYVTTTGDGSSNDPGWTAFTSANTASWNKGQGIRVFIRGDKGQGLDFNSATLANDYAVGNPTLTLSGNINQGDQTINLVNAGASWNFVGNPFASPVDLNLATRNNVSNFIYVWNTNIGLRGGYSAAIDISAATYKLPAYSAFFTQATGASPSIVFTEASKATTETSGVLFKQASTSNTLKLKLESSDGIVFWDEWMLNLNDKRNNNKEVGFDAYKLINNDVNLYSTTADNYRLSVDARKYESDAIIPLSISSTKSRSLTIKVTEANVEAGQELYLYDKELKTYTQLDLNVSYTFTSNTNANNRFEIVMRKGIKPLLNNETLMVNVYPNPAKASTVLEFNAQKAGKLVVTIFNAEGKQMDILNFGEQQTGKLTLNTAKYAKGMYTLQIQIGEELIIKKLVKE